MRPISKNSVNANQHLDTGLKLILHRRDIQEYIERCESPFLSRLKDPSAFKRSPGRVNDKACIVYRFEKAKPKADKQATHRREDVKAVWKAVA